MKRLLFLKCGLMLSLSGCLVTRQEVRNATKPSSISQEQVAKADLATNYQEADERIRQLNGRIETLENNINILQADKSGLQTESQAEKKLLNEKLKIYEEAISKLEVQLLALSQKVEILQTQNKSSSTGKANSNSAQLNSFDSAANEFSKKNWKESIVSFEKYRTLNPKGKRYGEATYKIGYSFQELGMTAESRAFYNEVIEKFPKTDWAQKARDRLKSLK